MPIYEYQCVSCKQREEIIQKISDPPLAQCPQCGGEMKKLISSPAIQFKGSGFYKTDYPSASSKGSSGSTTTKSSESSGSDSKTESKSETKSETKSEAKAESKGDSSS
ncbi:MAG TPA: FmdB family zinc ribbon protein [Thermoanaerobaculia bacterium]